MVQTFDMVFWEVSYDVYNAVYAMAYVLHEVLLQHEAISQFTIENCPVSTAWR